MTHLLNCSCISVALIVSVILCYVQENAAVVQENGDILGEENLLPRRRQIRHVPVLRNGNKLSPSVTTSEGHNIPVIDLNLSKEAQPRSSELNNSAEIDFSEEDNVKGSSTVVAVPLTSTKRPAKIDDHSSIGSGLETNFSNSQSLNAVDFSESPSESKVQRAIHAANAKETVVIDQDKDKAFDENEKEGSSNLWIYSNAICILLVVGVSIFLIYYPKKDRRRKGCKDSSESSSSSSSDSSTV